MEDFLRWAEKNGWIVELTQPHTPVLPDYVRARYPVLPEEYLSFLGRVKTCRNPADTAWFSTEYDFANPPPDGKGFRWDEFERISLEAAGGIAPWEAEIRAFWDRYFPFFLTVGGGYGYYAFDITDGSVVRGMEPEFEQVEKIEKNLGDFLDRIRNGLAVLV